MKYSSTNKQAAHMTDRFQVLERNFLTRDIFLSHIFCCATFFDAQHFPVARHIPIVRHFFCRATFFVAQHFLVARHYFVAQNFVVARHFLVAQQKMCCPKICRFRTCWSFDRLVCFWKGSFKFFTFSLFYFICLSRCFYATT